MPPKRHFPDFIAAYLESVSHHEASEKLHLWTCLSVLAGALERKVFLNRGYYELYPNLYIFIVGPSGIVKKSTTTGFGLQMLRELPDLKIMSDRVTASSLIDQLASAQKKADDLEDTVEHASIFIYASELIVFVKEVFGSVIELLTTFWDCPKYWSYKTKNSGSVAVRGVCLNMLAATTVQWLREGITSQIMTAGFAGRVIFVCDTKGSGKWVAWPEPPKDFKEKREMLMEDLHQIHALKGEMKPSDDFKQCFSVWYNDHMNLIASQNSDSRMNGYYGRKGEMLLKIAMLKSISESNEKVLLMSHFEWARNQIDLLENDLVEIYAPPKESEARDRRFKVLEHIFSKKETKLSDIKRTFATQFNGPEVDKIIEELILSEYIFIQRKLPLKDPKQVFKFNESISSPWDRSRGQL